MLSEKRLIEISKVRAIYGCENCHKLQNEAIAAATTALVYRAMLERHVWQKRSSDGKYFCIECRNLEENGHNSICELAAMLKEG